MKHSIVIYSKFGCDYCSKLRNYLISKEIEFEYLVYEMNFSRDKFSELFGDATTFPQVTVNGKPIGGLKSTIKFLVEQKLV